MAEAIALFAVFKHQKSLQTKVSEEQKGGSASPERCWETRCRHVMFRHNCLDLYVLSEEQELRTAWDLLKSIVLQLYLSSEKI